MADNLEGNIESSLQGRRITIDLTPKAAGVVEGLRKLARQSTPDFFRYCLSVGMQVIAGYETGGTAYIKDKKGNSIPIQPPKSSEDYPETFV